MNFLKVLGKTEFRFEFSVKNYIIQRDMFYKKCIISKFITSNTHWNKGFQPLGVSKNDLSRHPSQKLLVISKWYYMWYLFLASFWYQSDITCDILQYLFMISKWYHLWYHKVISLWYHFDIIVISLHLFIPIALWYTVFSLLFLMKS